MAIKFGFRTPDMMYVSECSFSLEKNNNLYRWWLWMHEVGQSQKSVGLPNPENHIMGDFDVCKHCGMSQTVPTDSLGLGEVFL